MNFQASLVGCPRLIFEIIRLLPCSGVVGRQVTRQWSMDEYDEKKKRTNR